MAGFLELKGAIQDQFKSMSKGDLFRTDIGKDALWDTYLSSFPEGTNPIFRERTEHDCQCCKSFIRACGNVVAITDNKKISIWDVNVGGPFQVVADALSALVKSKGIANVFLHTERNLGTDKNRELSEAGEVINTWNHFHYQLPTNFVELGADIGPIISDKQSAKDVFKRGLVEITPEAINTVIELIDQNSLYRGQEHKQSVTNFSKEKVEFDKLKTDEERDLFSWVRSVKIGGLARVRNSAIGTLLVDLSDGMDLDGAVKSFETKVAPMNYKRPTALITKAMIAQAQKKVEELGIAESLTRRFATVEDITVNNILFVDRATKKSMDVFDEMAQEVPAKVNSLSKVEEVSIDSFIGEILPKSESLEVLFENAQENNLMSLVAPVNVEAKPIFKWGNNFSWSYNGEVTDSIKERVKKAGGNVSGVLRCSLSWFNFDDLDIHVIEPDGNHIGFHSKRNPYSSGSLDVDMNANDGNSREAVENIIWTNKSKMQEGRYKLYINQYSQRENIDVGFDVEVEFGGEIYTFNYGQRVRDNVIVAEFTFDRKNGIKFIESLPSSKSTKEVWGVSTNCFQKVKLVMNSPNHWDGNQTGNKHWFFVLEDCKNPKEARGFFNEFLDNDLTPHRKVFEVMSSKMKTGTSDNQLSGLGFSSTQRSHLICKVSGSFSRTVKINF